MTALSELKEFDLQHSEVTLWTFKGTTPKLNGHWIETTDALDTELRSIFSTQLGTITEEVEYTLLAQNNEASMLSIPIDETHAGLIADAIDHLTPNRKTRDIKTLKNARFYVLRLFSNGVTIFAVKKTDTSWKTKPTRNILMTIYTDKSLDIAVDEGFRIQRNFDFFAIGNQLLVANKKYFESILSYRAAHENDFAALRNEHNFNTVFADLTPLEEYVGTNRMHLRRMSAIRAKGFYQNKMFMKNLRERYKEFGLDIQFDEDGNIVPTPETCKDIMTALLDHRLQSGFSGNNYDVPDAVRV